jgi:hypothetical protein
MAFLRAEKDENLLGAAGNSRQNGARRKKYVNFSLLWPLSANAPSRTRRFAKKRLAL